MINTYTKEPKELIARMAAEKEGVARRIQQGETEYDPFKPNKNNYIPEEGILEDSYLGMICDAQSNIRVAIEGLKQRKMQGLKFTGGCGELILLELDIESSLLKLKNIAVGRGL